MFKKTQKGAVTKNLEIASEDPETIPQPTLPNLDSSKELQTCQNECCSGCFGTF